MSITSKMKFVTFDGYEGEKIIVFPAIIQHSDFARSVTQMSYNGLHPISGGFVIDGQCVGESISLRMKSRGEADTALLKTLLNIPEEVEEDEHVMNEGRIKPVQYLSPKFRKVGRNDPCPCGSGLKYKKCCL